MSGSNDPGVDDPVQFFKKTSASAIRRVLERADRNAAKEARRQQNLIRSALRPRSTLLGKALGRALAHHGRAGKGRASIRQTAPDTGGRPYHFGFSNVTKGESARGGRGGGKGKAAAGRGTAGSTDTGDSHEASQAGGRTARKGRSAGSAGAGGKINGTPRSREAAHQNYAERFAALEKNAIGVQQAIREEEAERRLEQEIQAVAADRLRGGPAQDREQEAPGTEVSRSLTLIEPAGRGQDGPDLSQGRGGSQREVDPALSQDWVEREIGRGPGLSDRHSEAAAQAYIENPGKTAQLQGTTASFGTIGETFEDRLEFWDLVHKHESKDGRTQSRLVVELPHEADAKARHEIVRRFTEDLLEKGIPFWASIHAPTKQNDYRNHHAHIVFIDRPASRMVHPDTGEMAWDFTISQTYKTACRHSKTSFPFRQNRDPDMRDRGYIKRSRARFSEITNEVMQAHGVGIRYDPRSYRDMGLDVAPMNHVSRILADKTKSQAFVVMDPDWTRKMINAEMKAAAIRRDETYQALRATEDRLQAITRTLQNTASANKVLPKDMQLSPGHRLTRTIGNQLVRRWTEAERDRLAAKFVDEVTIRTLKHIVEATTPKTTTKGPAKIHNVEQAPDAEDLRHLNDAAREELQAYKLQAVSRSRFHGARLGSVAEEWRAESTGTTQRRKSTPPQPDAPRREAPLHKTAERPTTPGGSESPGSRRSPPEATHAQNETSEQARARHAAMMRPSPAPFRRPPPSTPQAAAEAARIEEGLKWARDQVTARTQQLIRAAGSPDELVKMAEAMLHRTPAENAYDAAMARMRQKAREQILAESQRPSSRIISSETVTPVADLEANSRRRRETILAQGDAASQAKPIPSLPDSAAPITASGKASTSGTAGRTVRQHDQPLPMRETANPGRDASAHGQRLPEIARLRAASATTLSAEGTDQASLPTKPLAPTGQSLVADVAQHDVKKIEKASTPRTRQPPGRAGTIEATGPGSAAPGRQPELFKDMTPAPGPTKTAQELPPADMKPQMSAEEIAEDEKRKKRRRALLAEGQRNRGGFTI